MKMVKSLLLGTAAGLVAMSGAQAADLPVKAKPVQYVKICSLYGAGFYYIPGTDTCLKVGGFVRTEWNWNANGSFGQNTAGSNALYTRAGQQLFNRSRAILTMDARSQTDYGTLRSYFRAGWQWTSGDYQIGGSQGGSSLTGGTTSSQNSSSFNGAGAGFAASSSTTYLDRAFIQIAGFTFGKTQSFFDFFNTGAYSMQTNFLWVDTGGNGTPVAAYTAQFGNGLTATVSIEDQTEQQRLPIVAVGSALTNTTGVNNTALFAPGSSNPTQNAGYVVPDIVGNLRVDQAWGSAQIMGALHDNRAAYYNSTATGGAGNTAHPSDVWGWAGGAGLTINLPMLGKGDTISGMATYCHGASRYCMAPSAGVANSGAMFGLRNGSTLAGGWGDDAYFDGTAANGGSLQLPNAYSLVAGINHYIQPNLQLGAYAGYLNYKTNSSAVDALCAAPGSTTNGSANTGYTGTAGPGCANWSAWNAGSRVQWTPVANLDVGLEVMYIAANSGFSGFTRAGSTGTPATLTMGNAHVWSAIFRVQRNFWP